MPQACFQHVALTAIATCTGPIIRTLEDEAHLFTDAPEQLDRIRQFVGIHSRHMAPVGVTTLDMGEAAAKRLLKAIPDAKDSVDAIVFVTQTPDHPQPSNANLLHGRLGMGKHVAAFDLNQGCSGWVYGAYVAASMIEAGGCRSVLLLSGDTVSQTIHPRDRAVVPLFGDACAASLLVRKENSGPWWFDLHSDGTGHDAIKIPAGAHRMPRSPDTAREVADGEGNVRTADNLAMNGLEVFNFTLREEPGAVRALLGRAGVTGEDVDAFVFHQANHFILSNLAKRLKVPMNKVPADTLARFGNQSSASIPSALCHDLGARLGGERLRLLCSGFGVGLSWASCLFFAGPLALANTFQYKPSPNPP
jgi:3-oxoacyl-[acyl-carrier-protein] synthase III